jgi:hypothetical protein
MASVPHEGQPGGVEAALLAPGEGTGAAAGPGRPAHASGVSHAIQGHAYKLDTGGKVIALTSGDRPIVAKLTPGEGWGLGRPFQVPLRALTPAPMKYFHGDVPV